MAKLPTRTLGKNGPQVSALGFGAMGLSFSYGAIDADPERFKVLDKALELGATFWDTSDVCAWEAPSYFDESTNTSGRYG